MIRLPIVETRPGATAHSYPFQVSMQTLQFLQASFFYVILQDMASGTFVRKPGAIEALEKEMLAKGGDQASIDLGWKFLSEYLDVFRYGVFQTALITLNSHWNWYVRKIVAFIIASRNHAHAAPLIRTEEKKLIRAGFLNMTEQLGILEKASATTFALEDDDREKLREMSLVRNLGLHNRWEVDEHYLALSKCHKYGLNHLRLFDHLELRGWHSSLLRAVSETAKKVAQSFRSAPPFSHT